MSTRRVGEVARAGPYAAFLGSAYNPVWTEFRGTATKKWLKTLQEQKFDDGEPYMGITPDSRFELATATELPADALATLDKNGDGKVVFGVATPVMRRPGPTAAPATTVRAP